MVGLIGLNRGINPRAALASGSSSPYLDGVLSSCIFDCDATIAASYGGSGQTWANLIAAPSTGESQTDYDFHLGDDASAEATDPTFTGSAGDPAAYFALDGGDRMTCKTLTTYISDLYRTDISNPGTLVMCFQLGTTGFQYLMGHGVFSGGQGYSFRISGASLGTFGRGDSSTFTETVIASAGWATSTDYCMIISVDQNAGTGKVALNATTVSDWTVGQTTSTSASDTFPLKAASGLNNQTPMANGGRLYHFSAFNEVFDDSKAAAVVAHLNTRHSRTYA